MARVLLTGGCGFVGHHVAAGLVADGHHVTILDKLTYASVGFNRLRDVGLVPPVGRSPLEPPAARVDVFSHDFAQPLPPYLEEEIGAVDILLHLGAETHVDRSIEDAEPFVLSNVLGTLRVLELARRRRVSLFLYFSTDEVFGPAPPGVAYKEGDRYQAGNPYAASKAGGEQLAVSYANTHRLPVIVTHTMNIFGPRQHPEKFIPATIAKVLGGELVTVHADPTRTIAGSRFYLYADDLVAALRFVLEHGQAGEAYNIVGDREVSNLEVAEGVARHLDRDLRYELVDFHTSRPGHDLRYALDGSKLAALGWRPSFGFDRGLQATVDWYRSNPGWLNGLFRQAA